MLELPTGTVTFVFTDVEGSTRLLDSFGPKRYAEALADHRRLLRDAFGRHGGVEVDTQGDAFFVAFPVAGEAVAAAREAQGALEAGALKVRMALHTGEPIVTQEGYVGMDVHRAARICSTVHGGQVILSERTRTLVDDTDLVDLGRHRLKDLTQPERLFQLGPEIFPPLRSLNATNLPMQPSALIGRERETEELVSLVRAGPLVTLTGPGGVGKTRLALQVAAEVVEAFPDGVFWVPLATIGDPDAVLPTVAQTLGAKEELHEYIDGRKILLLLDNLEQVLGVAPKLSELLDACPHLHLLVTSRALLRVDREHQCRVGPLSTDEAVHLFRQRAAVAEPLDAVVEICRRVDRLPLAVELAAARTTLLAPAALLARLQRALPVLTTGRRDAPQRHRTLRATIEWSYDLLDESERRLFRRLAVFAGSFDPAAAEAVAGAELDTLQSLVEKSLVRRWGSGRLGMLETIHEFSLELLEASGEVERLRRRHAEFVLELVDSASLSDEGEGPERSDLVRPEAGNVRAALEWSLATGEVWLGLRIASALEQYWIATSPFEGMRWLDSLLAQAEGIPGDLRARALRVWGGVTFIVGRFEEGARLFEESLAAYRRLGDERGIGLLLHRLANFELVRGDTVRARLLAEESGDLLHGANFHKGELLALGTLGEVELEDGNYDRGLQLLRESAALADEIGYSWWKAVTLAAVAEHLVELDRLEEAEAPAREALAESHAIGERQFRLLALALLARIAGRTGRVQRAGTLWGAVETEEARGPVGQWEGERAAHAAAVLAAAGPDFEQGRANGRRLPLEQVVEYAVAGVH
ncbi:MAG TPA: adenylate/guanylate cyclase domain-containing protein [Actinomycetota bacterium]|nr:adenylate/guanylate cyclase domain-containing protein [Actinomycetota bacterium]